MAGEAHDQLGKRRTRFSQLRTAYSNERTLLSYFRTSVELLILAIAILKFFRKEFLLICGAGSIAAAVACFAIGIYRFLRRKKDINENFVEDDD